MATYTDKELSHASRVAYTDLNPAYEALKTKTGRDVFTIKELKEVTTDKEALTQLDKLTEEELNTWKISGIGDMNKKTGFYGCIIDTGDGNAILAFRGSEKMTDLENLQHDWVEADIGILNATKTNQYKSAQEFMRDNADTLNGYKSVTLTGHSLGGNLAAFSMITCDDCGVGDNFERCVNFDGPGFSQEFLDRYKGKIAKRASKIDHYKWSFVGSMLKDPEGVNSMFIKVTDEAKENFFLSGFTRHDMKSIDFDKDGYVKKGTQDYIGYISEKFTNLMDDLPTPVGDFIKNVLSVALLYGGTHPDIAVTLLLIVAVANPMLTAKIIGTALVVLTLQYVTENAEKIIDTVVNYAVSLVKGFKNWAAEKISAFCEGIRQGAKSFYEGCKRVFSSTYRNAQDYFADSFHIRLDTAALRDLAWRINSVNSRLDTIDKRIDTLYRKVKWTDLWSLMKADIKISWSKELYRCEQYLDDTADRFENAERQIMSML